MKSPLVKRLAVLLAVAAIAATAAGDDTSVLSRTPRHEFDFARLFYYDANRGWPGGSWRVDYPDAEYFFHKGVSRLTRVDMGDEGVRPSPGRSDA